MLVRQQLKADKQRGKNGSRYPYLHPYVNNSCLMKKLTLLLSLFIIATLLPSCENAHGTQAGWQKVYQNDAAGQPVFGEKEKLMDAVRLGYPIRIGWGSTRVEHVAEAEFLTIWEGEVFGQISPIIGQAPRVDGDTSKIRFRLQNHWVKIAGTNGYSTSFMTDYFADSLVGGGGDGSSATAWYVLYPAHAEPIEARPLWRDGSYKWEAWNKAQEEKQAKE